MITAKNEVNSMKQSNFNLYVIADALDLSGSWTTLMSTMTVKG